MIILGSSMTPHYFKHVMEARLLEKLAKAIPVCSGRLCASRVRTQLF
jgi:hypothetical protein